MGEEKEISAEEKILQAAVEEFIHKGRSGTRMQVIADKAGINKALLHYYYRSKDMLFEAVFSQVIKKLLISKVKKIIEEEKDVFDLIRSFTSLYIDVLNRNPNIPFFILDEIHRNPGRLPEAMMKSGLPIERVFEIIQNATRRGLIRDIDPRELIVNMISLCVFPLLGRNLMVPVIFGNDKVAFRNFLESRKTDVAEFIIQSIRLRK